MDNIEPICSSDSELSFETIYFYLQSEDSSESKLQIDSTRSIRTISNSLTFPLFPYKTAKLFNVAATAG